MADLPRLLLAAPGSGGGKTTVTCALLGALKNRGLAPTAFKCGPDYIDPMFHTEVLGLPGRNLDLFFAGEDTVRAQLAKHGGRDVAVIEGVMGYYDGIGGGDRAGSWHLAAATDTPAILVLDPGGMALSLAALVKGFLGFRREHRVAGLLLNRCGEGMYRLLAPLLERECGLPVLGYLPPMPDCAFESRHLGLVAAAEVEDLRQKVERLAAALERTVDVDRLLAIAGTAPPLEDTLPAVEPVTGRRPVVAVARDRAFCFYYRENLELLEALGAELAPFSPLEDESLPEGTAALYLGGGYPELHGERLAANGSMREAVRRAAAQGMPVVAECGGFQYLQETLTGADGARHAMAGVIASGSAPAGKLCRFGYVTLTARRDTLLCRAGESIAAHEFHHWDSDETGDSFTARKASGGGEWPCVVAEGSLFAGYPHLYFPNNPAFAERFVRAAAAYGG